MSYVLERLKEKSSWLGILNILGSLGLFKIDAALEEQLAAVGVALIGLVLVLVKDKK